MIRHATLAKLPILIRRAARVGVVAWQQWLPWGGGVVMVVTAKPSALERRKSTRRCRYDGAT